MVHIHVSCDQERATVKFCTLFTTGSDACCSCVYRKTQAVMESCEQESSKCSCISDSVLVGYTTVSAQMTSETLAHVATHAATAETLWFLG